MKFTFLYGNKFVFRQYGANWIGLPHNVAFDVEFLNDEKSIVKLTCPGYFDFVENPLYIFKEDFRSYDPDGIVLVTYE